MKKYWNRIFLCFLMAGSFWVGSVIADRTLLREKLIRLHIVANSDEAADQAVKLRIRNTVTKSLQEDMLKLGNKAAAMAYLHENLPKIEEIANQVLSESGFDRKATATLCREAFGIRQYDTFRLPSGVYDALRITIGKGEGQNWWCVVFPSLCLPGTTEEFRDVAVGSGFPDTLTDTLQETDNIQIRFYLLDLLGKLENIFHDGGI